MSEFISNFDKMLLIAEDISHKQRKKTVAVAAAHDKDVLSAVCEARKKGFVNALLFGDKEKIINILSDMGDSEDNFKIIDTPTDIESARLAVKSITDGMADFLMKGILQTGVLLSAALDKVAGIRTSNILSHVMVYEIPSYRKLLFLTDGGINTYPNMEQKIQIIENCLYVTESFGIENTKVSLIAGAEVVNPKIQATVDAKNIVDMEDFWKSKNATIEGPVGLDIAISKEACVHKGYSSSINGHTDVLVVPFYEVGNGIGKTLTYFVDNVRQAGVVIGAKCPIVLVSRSDSADSKLLSIAMATFLTKSV